ncbi:putative polygalacturonase [Rosa chinensis]|uniref:Putative polygalacturonase n=1 Tax=Rosa chinensis TaxID=74649 RepID=A0A2P6RRD3_ROSCH|nr:putative polygalacturonase [Rosa chinensis]
MTKLTSCFPTVVFIFLHILYQSFAFGDETTTRTYDVLKFGAKRNGVTNSTQAFLDAWSADCGSAADTTEIYVPKAETLSFTNSKDIRAEGLMSLNSQMFHIVINGRRDVLIQSVKVIAAGNSPNTDGIHVQFSRYVAIASTPPSKLGTIVSLLAPAPRNCGWNAYHADLAMALGKLNIGSLAKDLEEEGIQNVTLKNAIFKGTTNGLRIKSWARPSTGFVQGVRSLDVEMINVQNPIVIYQNYCPHNLNCPGQVSDVKVNDVLYQNIRGTSATAVAIKFDFSAANPCSGVKLDNVHLTCRKQVVQSDCTNVNVKSVGTVQPSSCL